MRKLAGFMTLVAAVALTSGLALAASSSSTASKPAHAAKPAAEKVDINAASKDDLEKLPGIGTAYSQKIIDGRPYKSKSELESKKILPKNVYDKVAPHIIAHQK